MLGFGDNLNDKGDVDFLLGMRLLRKNARDDY